MNLLWGGMILVGILYGAVTGNLGAVTEAAVDSAKEAVNLCVVMAGVTSLWVGLMKIAEKSGPDSPDYGENGTFSAFSLS